MISTNYKIGLLSSLIALSITGCSLELEDEEINVTPRYADVVIAPVSDDVDTGAGSDKLSLDNADLETGSTDPWFGNGPAVLTIEQTEVKAGSFSLKVTDRTDGWNGAAISFGDKLIVGHTYTVSVWVKMANVDSSNVSLTVKVADDDGDHYNGIGSTIATNTDWVELTGEYTHAPIGTETAEPYIYIEGADAGVEYYVDSLVVIDNDFEPGGAVDTSVALDNSGFESGVQAPWTTQGDAMLTLEPTEVKEGSFSALITGRSSGWHAPIYTITDKLVVGDTYYFSIWVKLVEETAENMKLSLKVVDDSGDNYITIANASVDNTAWVELTAEYVHASDGPETQVIVYVESDSPTASYYIDSLKIDGEAVVVPTNILPNGDFELGAGDSFENWGAWNGSVNVTAETTDVHGGNRGVKVVGTGTNPWDVQLGSDAVETVVGNEYVLSMWIKGEEDGGVVRFSTSSEAGALYGADETIGTSWQQVTWTFAANDVATQVVLDLGASAVTYLIDDVELIPVAAEPAYMLSADTVLLNGDLELGTDNDFDNWGKWNNGDGIVQELTEVHSGARSAKVTNGSDFNAEYQSQLVSDETTLVVGTTYSASVWIKGTVDGEVRFSTNETTPQYGATAMVTADWSQVVWEFTATEEVTRLVFDLGKTPDAVYYVDDFELVAK
ncbi:carbohydrate binding domain-containing protein [Psychrosphaera sp. 1_MG-2023]|uniref:carbohydrate binding domain-containing protein n=1 Tax=Psychrosphaera sp. 1_MG-2023 TaxID=3062643 RepID=UPI0026E205EF|nr:carbohydrate binding domain-containing protein [Psychrosphaera sp. 1_MG-2023]MDO6718672.1 carbohydrate binding domain-containing protein [Psychrosphaera sp. 1_MG-2023]